MLTFGCASALAQTQGSRVRITSDPVIVGPAVIGKTVTAGGGAWESPDPSRTQASWTWWRCPNPRFERGCERVGSDASYAVTAADRGRYLFLWRSVSYGRSRDFETSAPSAQITDPPAPKPTPTPTPTPAPTVAPTPVPSFDTPAAPVPTSGAVLRETARKRKVLKPFPLVRMKGVLSSNGAKVSVLSVRAPRSAKISLRCRGKGCPATRWSRAAAQRKGTLTRIGRFERNLRSGLRLTISVTRSGYVGKRTTFVIRRGAAPLRTDHCLSAKGRVTKCPAGT